MLKITSAVATNVGRIRSNNEDNFYFNGEYLKNNNTNFFERSHKENGQTALYAICDGMGGEEYGEEASYIAVSLLNKYNNDNFDYNFGKYLNEANDKICTLIKECGGKRIGTTIAMLCFYNQKVKAYNIGDSKTFVLRNNNFKQLSEDHTRVQSLIKMGILSKEQAAKHPDKNKLTQHLGIFREEMILQPYISEEIELKENDVFLLCSDGLTDMISEDEITKILSLSLNFSPSDIAHKLIDTALENGGKDNVTVIVVKITGDQTKRFWDRFRW